MTHPEERAGKIAEIEGAVDRLNKASIGHWSRSGKVMKNDLRLVLSELRLADQRAKEMAGLLREAAGVAHDNSMEGEPGNWWCAKCGSSAPGKQKAWPHFDQFTHKPDCLVTRLRTAADQAEKGL